MDELPSTTFRKVYATLKTPVVVTVSGHPIGTYTPISTAIDSRHVQAIRPGAPRLPDRIVMSQRDVDTAMRAFRPVPKPGRK